MQTPFKFSVRLFARLRELAGSDSLTVTAPASPQLLSVADVRRQLVENCPALAELLAVSAIAVNHEFAPDDQRLVPFDEIAVIPPVSGG